VCGVGPDVACVSHRVVFVGFRGVCVMHWVACVRSGVCVGRMCFVQGRVCGVQGCVCNALGRMCEVRCVRWSHVFRAGSCLWGLGCVYRIGLYLGGQMLCVGRPGCWRRVHYTFLLVRAPSCPHGAWELLVRARSVLSSSSVAPRSCSKCLVVVVRSSSFVLEVSCRQI
jgi:hypothetical protein